MSILVNFEDSYGIADIACKYFFNEYMELERNEKTYNGNVIVRRALSTGKIFAYRTIPKNVSTIIYVYDMDKQNKSAIHNILEPDDLKDKIDILYHRYNGIELRFVPIAFAAETICLHMIKTDFMDFSQLFSEKNTAHLHAKILTDILSNIHNDKNDRKYWASHGQGKTTFNVKRTRAYFDDLNDIHSVYKLLQKMNFSKTNKCLFDWITGGKIEDISKLLNAEQAIALQNEYINTFHEFLKQHDDYMDMENNRYLLNYNYR